MVGAAWHIFHGDYLHSFRICRYFALYLGAALEGLRERERKRGGGGGGGGGSVIRFHLVFFSFDIWTMGVAGSFVAWVWGMIDLTSRLDLTAECEATMLSVFMNGISPSFFFLKKKKKIILDSEKGIVMQSREVI